MASCDRNKSTLKTTRVEAGFYEVQAGDHVLLVAKNGRRWEVSGRDREGIDLDDYRAADLWAMQWTDRGYSTKKEAVEAIASAVRLQESIQIHTPEDFDSLIGSLNVQAGDHVLAIREHYFRQHPRSRWCVSAQNSDLGGKTDTWMESNLGSWCVYFPTKREALEAIAEALEAPESSEETVGQNESSAPGQSFEAYETGTSGVFGLRPVFSLSVEDYGAALAWLCDRRLFSQWFSSTDAALAALQAALESSEAPESSEEILDHCNVPEGFALLTENVVEHETEKAILLRAQAGLHVSKSWIPKSQIRWVHQRILGGARPGLLVRSWLLQGMDSTLRGCFV